MASRNGLNPKIKGPRGVGFGRALPAAFGFDNGIQPDGNDDYMTIPGLVDTAFPDKATVEFWTYKDTSAYGYCISILDTTTNLGVNCTLSGSSRVQRVDTNTIALNYTWPSSDDNIKTHFVLVMDKNDLSGNGSAILYVDGLAVSTHTDITSQTPGTINKFELFRYAPYGSLYSNYKMDEIRFYKSVLRPDQVTLNYNNRIGANPCETENLLAWYKFQTFENLDFSTLQDGSDIQLGVRDFSGKNNHAKPFNIDTVPSSGTYALTSF